MEQEEAEKALNTAMKWKKCQMNEVILKHDAAMGKLLDQIDLLENNLVLEIAKGDEQECKFCFLDIDDQTLLKFDTAPATHQIVACNTPDGYSDINRNRCFCSHLKTKSTKPLSDKELLSQAFSFHLENKTRELEKELSITKEELKIEREEVAKFQEKSEE
ncbi:8468_t:CDS:2 [Entrophospora sp. SA101]|nr:8468_t:CDS:2 [Entrophospora sp. SA101]